MHRNLQQLRPHLHLEHYCRFQLNVRSSLAEAHVYRSLIKQKNLLQDRLHVDVG